MRNRKNINGTSALYTSIMRALLSLFALIMFLMPGAAASAEVGALYNYSLSDFAGVVPYSWAGLALDKERDEIYVIYKNNVEVYNDRGMKVYGFGDDPGFSGVIYDVAVDKDGTIYVLSIEGDSYTVLRCNYRGEPVRRIEFRNMPPEFAGIMPVRIFYREGRLYLADLTGSKKVVVTDTDGVFAEGYDISAILDLKSIEDRPGREKDIAGFSVDHEGNMLMTIPTIFRAFIISPDRQVRSFGEAGNLPGKFSVAAGIASDEDGNYYVADTLKSVIMVFNRDFKFITEFGYRGGRPYNLIAPRNMVVDNGNIYVSQSRKRGISVFSIRGIQQGAAVEAPDKKGGDAGEATSGRNELTLPAVMTATTLRIRVNPS
ncbi:MAG: NHL repeat-containing protein [Nitrospirota bacterium]|nr:NHL repeat-containing protein [Nitrospirota bacterium]